MHLRLCKKGFLQQSGRAKGVMHKDGMNGMVCKSLRAKTPGGFY